MARKPRDYRAEYRRRDELARERGFKNYGHQRRYLEYTGESARYVVFPKEGAYIPSPRYDFGNYIEGDDEHLDVFLRMARFKGMDEEEAYDRYMRRGRGGQLSRGSLKDLEMDTFNIREDETWYP
jgi:hypothetical protein